MKKSWILMVALAACQTDDKTGKTDNKLTIHIFGAPQMYSPVAQQAADFEAETGIAVELVKQDDFGQLYGDILDYSGNYDAFLSAAIWVPDFVDAGIVADLSSYIDADLDNPELAWSDIPSGVQRKNDFAGGVYGLIADNDNMFMHYRKDVLSDATWRAAFLLDRGHDLPNPPATLDELLEVSEWFADKDWNPDVDNEASFTLSTDGAGQTHYYALAWAAPYTVEPADVATSRGLLYFDADMTPRVNKPGFIAGLTKWKQMIDCCTRPEPGNTNINRVDVITQFIEGRALFAIDWGDIGPAAFRENSVVAGKVGWALPPGSRSYYSAAEDGMVDTASVHYAPVHQFNGFSWYVTNSGHKDLAWQFVRFMQSPAVSSTVVTAPAGGYQPWRTSHSTNLTPWTATGWNEGDAHSYTQAILDSTNHPNAVFDTRLPLIAQYEAVLEAKLAAVASGEASIQDAMDETAAAWNAITDDKGRSVQISAYADHLGTQQ